MYGKQSRYYKILDLSRLYCAGFIVFIHMGISSDNPVLFSLTRQGVPFFFLVSGFFWAKTISKREDITNTTKQYVSSILTLYIIWMLIWSPIMIKEYRELYPDSKIKLIAILCRRFVLAGIAPYWYLLVLVEGTVILAIIKKSNRKDLGSL